MTDKCALIMVNNLSRLGESNIDPVVRILKRKAIDSIVVSLDRMEDISRLIDLYRDKVDRIIVGGGDGTLNAAVRPVVESGLPLGILPLGTANDLARTLEIPFPLEEDVEVITRRPKQIDIDGELIGLTPAYFSIKDKLLPVFVPEKNAAALSRRILSCRPGSHCRPADESCRTADVRMYPLAAVCAGLKTIKRHNFCFQAPPPDCS